MAKNVALSNEAYKVLERLKKPEDSFSDVVIKNLGERRPSWRDSIGALKGNKEAEKIFDKILEDRHKIIKRSRRVIRW